MHKRRHDLRKVISGCLERLGERRSGEAIPGRAEGPHRPKGEIGALVQFEPHRWAGYSIDPTMTRHAQASRLGPDRAEPTL